MNEAPYEQAAHEAIRASMLLTDEERAALDVTQMRVVDMLHLATLLAQADAAILTIEKTRKTVARLLPHEKADG